MVEALLDAAEVAAEPLVRRLGAAAGRELVPVAANRPFGRLDVEPAGSEPVGEDLVDDRAEVPVGAAGVEGHDEVVRVRDVVVDDAKAVQPRVAELAAREEPAITDGRVADREARNPPALAVALRLDRARFAVLRVPERDRIHFARRAHAHDRLAAQLVWPLEDVDVGAVVVRLAEERRFRLEHAHPFTEPWVRPETMKRCRNMKRATTGTAAINTPAAKGPHFSE